MNSDSLSELENYIAKHYKPTHRHFSLLAKERHAPGSRKMLNAILEAQRLTRKEIYKRRTGRA